MAKYIVFVHGLGGEIEKTWGKFPEFLMDDKEIGHIVIQYGYTSPNPVTQLYKPAPSILSIANGLLTDLTARCDLDKDDIILVGHSLGGLVIRRMLLRLDAKGISHNIRKVCFFDVPHEGSGFAKVGQHVAFLNRHLKSLASNSTELDDLNEQWIDKKIDEHLNILSVIDANETIVSAMSSKSIFRYHPIETINGVDHSTIVKPQTANDTAVLVLKSFIKSKPSIGKFNLNRASKSVTDWLKYDERRHELEYLEDKAREVAYKGLDDALESSTPIVRLTGLSGLGKSRLLIEYKNRHHIEDDDLLIFNGSGNSEDVIHGLKLAVENKAEGLAIIDNCPIELHNRLVNIVAANKAPLKMVTTFFYHDADNSLNNSIQIKLEKLEENLISKIIDLRLPNLDESSKKRLNKFIEGFPLLADMATKELQTEGAIKTTFSEIDLVEKLINGDNNLTDKQRELLKVFSLFDYFRFQRDQNEKANEHATFLNEIAGTSQIEFEGTVKHFEGKELINCTGTLARIVPKPLALNLAMEWWNKSLFDRQSHLIINLPKSMIESFCKQITFLDSSLNVQDFVKNFCEGGSPFGQAELLLSKQGARLFRALVEVNPHVTSDLLYRTLERLSDDEISNIGGDVRRNFVWSLEMLVFHKSFFEKASWCLFKLAQFENESYGNNSTGQFSQLFRWQLSGTEADFAQRLTVLDKALVLNVESADRVVVKAIKTALNTHGGTRTCGAEYQGTKLELKEWVPEKWQEIYDYWQSLLNILVVIAKRGQLVEEVKETFGHQLRSLTQYKQFEQLDGFIKEIIKLTGKYWPAAAQSINHALHYDKNGMDQPQIDFLTSWEKLLSPDENSLEEKLKLIVLNPSREHVKGEDGHYIDMAAEDAKKLAGKLKYCIEDLVPHLGLIMSFTEQKQSYIFAKQLMIEASNVDEFLNAVFDYLRENDKTSIQFLRGILSAIYNNSHREWQKTIELFGSDPKLNRYYPDVICTGNFNSNNLNTLLNLIKNNQIPSYSASALIFGCATDHLSEAEISEFCTSLSAIDHNSVWVALDIINMYTHGRNDLDFNILKPVLLHLVLTVSFKKEDKFRHSDSYHWLESVKKLLLSEGEDFALKLCLYLIKQVGSHDVDYSDLWDYLGVAFYKAFERHGAYIWPQISNTFLHGKGIKQYRLIGLLGSGKSFREKTTCIFDLLGHEVVVRWCRDEVGLLLVGRSISMFINENENRKINPLMVKLISEYGDDKAFLREISANFSSRGWTGSLVPYLEADKVLIKPLIENESVKVSSWALNFIEYIDSTIEYEHKRDAEDNVLRG